MFLNKQIFAQEEKLREKNMLVLRTSNFEWASVRPKVPRHKHSVVFTVHH